MDKIAVRIDGPSITLRDGDWLRDTHVLIESPTYGRVLFTEAVGVQCCDVGARVTISGCVFEFAG